VWGQDKSGHALQVDFHLWQWPVQVSRRAVYRAENGGRAGANIGGKAEDPMKG